ncbi:MAG: DNA polymerase [bacterium]|nr:DNA polymerase [bacterium]
MPKATQTAESASSKQKKGTSEEPKLLVLIDAHAVLHRAYHALPQFTSSRGEPTGGLYGLSTMLLKIITTFHPDYIVAAYDLPKPTFRHEAYKAYKEGRAKADEALVSQMIRSREIFGAFNIPIYDKEGFEADDVLGTIVEQITNHQSPITKNKEPLDSRLRGNDRQVDIVIATGDMDALQLVSDKKVQVFTLKKGINDTILYDEEAVKARFGFGPELLPDFKGLKGDPSDNIKGVAGIGDKTATDLIVRFGTIENIYKQLNAKRSTLNATVRPRTLELLEKGKEEAEFSKLLGTIRRDVPIDFSLPEKLWCESVDLPKAEALFTQLEFRQLLPRLAEAVKRIGNKEYGIQDGEDTPTTPPRGLGTPPQAGGEEEKKKVTAREVKEGPSQASLTDVLATSGIPPQELKEASVALWLINSALTNPTIDDIYGFAQTREWGKAREAVFDELKERKLTRVFEDIERPLIPVVDRMNERGVHVDASYLQSLSKEYHKELSLREKDIVKMSGVEFNINSPKQLGEVLFVKMGLKGLRQKKTAGGALSTKESELEKMRELHPIIGKILEYREFQKLLSTYIDNIPAMVGGEGRLHAKFLSAGSTTGRMASQNPNLQNIPIQTELGRRIRNAFCAETGNKLVSVDYSQIELRIAAILSGDKKFVQIFKNGEDVHTSVAAEVFNVAQGKVTKEMRRQAKVINFGILYGMGVNSLRQALAEGGDIVSREDAQTFLDEYFSRFYELAGYLEETKKTAHTEGFTETLFGRRRYHEAIHSNIPYIRSSAERQAANAPMQGTGADIIKLAMVKVDEYLKAEKLEKDASLILQVHDELVYEVKEERAEKVALEIKHIMEQVLDPKMTHGVPIVAEASIGDNWGEMGKIDIRH